MFAIIYYYKLATSESWHMYQRIRETPKQFQRVAGIAPEKSKQCSEHDSSKPLTNTVSCCMFHVTILTYYYYMNVLDVHAYMYIIHVARTGCIYSVHCFHNNSSLIIITVLYT